ncbi:MAG: hypothetical protein BLM47_05670 [Candidatus Reconcilbacillus cellulovorans]|uniref:ANTAR domain-containing protein n=1 Tax=Candidatus Reconcilbacillus cellulovorans TaxID=1906605 RepID=A0A2A6E054_9BACL|nr:MAG: hypothetical protein BLM47_05670 [Candidatus Reconcilbacillus cellulovorans]
MTVVVWILETDFIKKGDGWPPADPRFEHRIAASESDADRLIGAADAVMVAAPAARIPHWASHVRNRRSIPLIWICRDTEQPLPDTLASDVDGVVPFGANADTLRFAVRWAACIHRERANWLAERKQLIERLEGRKWIDQAKAILCEIKGCTEAQAYEFLRTQAMNERKKIADIAANIVRVYRLIREQPSSRSGLLSGKRPKS